MIFCSLLVTLALIHYQHLHEKISGDHDLSGPQKVHTYVIPRIGGIDIFLAIIFKDFVTLSFLKLDRGLLFVQLMACALPTFLNGLLEDIIKKSELK
jgi:UDP-N-acetylmuramyl pentapeptide phosphotransferase/UDP-N-acetylglucosamine-1-phosphate transferase